MPKIRIWRSRPEDSEPMAEMSMTHRIVVALIAKGSMNNLHRNEVVEAFRKRNIELSFLVRQDYFKDMKRLSGCDYLTCRITEPAGQRSRWINLCRFMRYHYSAAGLGLISDSEDEHSGVMKLFRAIARQVGRYQWVSRLIVKIEEQLMRGVGVEELDHTKIDQMLLLGIGTHGSESEATLTFWARRLGITVVHMIANYDHLTSKGYRGVPVDHLLVWGAQMNEDAVELHGIERERVTPIGSVRYNLAFAQKHIGRNQFLRKIGLDPSKKTILFAGGMAEFHYFEMIQLFEELKEKDSEYQLIMRLYPDKSFMRGPHIKPLIFFCINTPGVYASIADPNYAFGIIDQEVPQIEEDELIHALEHSDVVINLLSTIALEACIYDKPIIYMLYYPMSGYAWRKPPEYIDYTKLLHNRRMVDYDLAEIARSREELINAIEYSIENPKARQGQRKRAVLREIGELDGRGYDRLVEACCAAFAKDLRKDRDRIAVCGAAEPRTKIVHGN